MECVHARVYGMDARMHVRHMRNAYTIGNMDAVPVLPRCASAYARAHGNAHTDANAYVDAYANEYANANANANAYTSANVSALVNAIVYLL